MLRGPIAGSLNRLDDAELLNRLRNRVIAEQANHVDITVRLALTDGDAYDLRIINNVLRVSWPDEERVIASHWQTDKATIIAVLTDELTLAESLRSGRIATSDNTRDSARQNRIFAGLFE